VNVVHMLGSLLRPNDTDPENVPVRRRKFIRHRDGPETTKRRLATSLDEDGSGAAVCPPERCRMPESHEDRTGAEDPA